MTTLKNVKMGEMKKTRQRRRTGNRSGFTLLEILVSFAILIVGLAIVAALSTTTARQAELVEEETGVQLACQNLMNSILAGDAVVSLGVEIPFPDVPNWTARVELLDGPISNLVAIRIVATRFETIETPHPTDPTRTISTRSFDAGRRCVLKEWARRADVRMQTVRRNLDGTVSTVEGTAADLPASNVANGTGTGSGVAGGLGGFGSAETGTGGANGFDVLDNWGGTGGLGGLGGLNGSGSLGASGSLGGAASNAGPSPFAELDAAADAFAPTVAPPTSF